MTNEDRPSHAHFACKHDLSLIELQNFGNHCQFVSTMQWIFTANPIEKHTLPTTNSSNATVLFLLNCIFSFLNENGHTPLQVAMAPLLRNC